MSNWNSVPEFGGKDPGEAIEALGITRLSGEDWNQIIGGLIFQGGLCSGSLTSFSVPFPKKVFGIYGTNVHPSFTLEGFTPAGADIGRTFFWFAIGI